MIKDIQERNNETILKKRAALEMKYLKPELIKMNQKKIKYFQEELIKPDLIIEDFKQFVTNSENKPKK